jgi:hypothetical protein
MSDLFSNISCSSCTVFRIWQCPKATSAIIARVSTYHFNWITQFYRHLVTARSKGKSYNFKQICFIIVLNIAVK